MVANRDYDINTFIQVIVDIVGCVIRNIDAPFLHDRNSIGMNSAGMSPTTENVKLVISHIAEQSFSDLRSTTVPGADKKNFLFFNHG
jgi:hypothetical protein